MKHVENINPFAFPQNDLFLCVLIFIITFFHSQSSYPYLGGELLKSKTVSLIILHLPHPALICLPPAATEFFPIHLSYLLFISFCELGNCLIKLAKNLLRSVLGSETSIWDTCLSTQTPDLSTDFYISRNPLGSWGCHIRECTWIQAL